MVASLTKVAGEPSLSKYRQPLMDAREFFVSTANLTLQRLVVSMVERFADHY
jgi:hypothetical protein